MRNSFLDNKRVLITHPFLYEINGATNVTLELAQFLQDSHAKVKVYTNIFDNPVKQFFEESKIQVDIASDKPKYHFKDFDYIWINSQTFPVSLLEELSQSKKPTNMPKIIFMHMSAHEDCADEMPYIYKFEESLSSLSLFVSEEAFQVNKKYFEKLPKHNYYRNPAPTAYCLIDKTPKELKKILVVSNHPCQEALEIRKPLAQKDIIVDYLGIIGDRYTMINEKILSEYDAVISIGKTVQYCLVSGIPVYIYDQFGGPGWLNDNNYLKAREKNFSGRGFQTKTPKKIIDELISGYKSAATYHLNNKPKFQKEYSINQVIPALFKQANLQTKKTTPLSNANIAAHRSLLRLVEIDFNKWHQVYANNMLHDEYKSLQQNYNSLKQSYETLNNKLMSLESENQDLKTIVNSRSVKTWLKLNNITHNSISYIKRTIHNVTKPEIIAVLCVYNEELNIDECLNHIEPYIDKIVILDDGSTDNTVKIAKKHPKVVKIITTQNKTSWQERKNRALILNEAQRLSKRRNSWVLCLDADERFELPFLRNLRKIATRYCDNPTTIWVHFRELWDDIYHYRTDNVWGEKKKDVFFPLSQHMTFNYSHEHHIPWHYQELDGKDILTDYNLYHLKMIKPIDRQKRADLYNKLDPNKEMQSIGYDYLTDVTNLSLSNVPDDHPYDYDTVPDYYK